MYKIEQKNNYQIIYIYNEITQANYFEFKNIINPNLLSLQKNTILDISKLSYIDSLGLGFIAQLNKEILKNGGKLVILAPNQHIYEVLKMAGFLQYIQTFGSIHEAIDYIKTNKI